MLIFSILLIVICVTFALMISLGTDINIVYSTGNKIPDNEIIKNETVRIPNKEVNMQNLSDNSITIGEIPRLQLTETNKESESDKKVAFEAEQNISAREKINQSLNTTSEHPRINKRWYGLDIYSAAELKEVNSSFPNLRAVNPPDITIAVGKDHVIQLVHSAIQIWNKTGEPLKKVSLHDFFNISKSNYITDPAVTYDKSSGKWFATIVDGGRENMTNGSSYPTCQLSGCKVILAISDHEDPNRTWSLYPINATKSGYFPDIPKISVSKFNLTMSTIEFQVYPKWKDQPSYPKTYMIDKNLLSKSNPTMNIQYMEPVTPDYPIQFINPSNCSSTAALYKENSSDVYSPVSKMKITDYCNPNDMGSFIGKEVQIPRLYPAPIFRQPLLNETHDDNENQKFELTILTALRNDTTIWIGLHSACQPNSISNNSCVNILRMDKINRTGNLRTPSYEYNITENTQFHINHTDVYYPAIGISKDGRLFFISGFSNSTIYPSLMASYLASENKTENRILIFGSNINNSTSYGDYFGSAIDPVDGSVWLSGQYVDDSVPLPDNIPLDELRRTQDKTWSTIIANVS